MIKLNYHGDNGINIHYGDDVITVIWETVDRHHVWVNGEPIAYQKYQKFMFWLETFVGLPNTEEILNKETERICKFIKEAIK